MPAPKRPNTAAAAEARRRIGLETMADKLTVAGWLAISPERQALLPDDLREQLRLFLLVTYNVGHGS